MNMTRTLFEHIIQQYVLPLIPVANEGRIISSDECSFANMLSEKTVQIISEGDFTYICFSPRQIMPEFYYISKLSCASDHLKTARSVLNQILSSIGRAQILDDDSRSIFYVDALCQTSVTIGLCSILAGSIKDSSLLTQVIYALEKWSQKTYEGRKVPFGIIIDFDNKEYDPDKRSYISFLDSKYSASFSDGVFSAIVLNAHGQIMQHLSLPTSSAKTSLKNGTVKKNHYSLVPERFENFSKQCYNLRIGVIALSSGDILTVKGCELLYAKREGRWLAYGYSAFFRPCMNYVMAFSNKRSQRNNTFVERISKSIYLSILDASFAHTGACISVVDFKQYDDGLKVMLHNCLISEDIDKSDDFVRKVGQSKYDAMTAKHAIIRQLTHYKVSDVSQPSTHSFAQLSQKLRVELLSMDGATVIDKRGIIRSVGAILRISPGSEEGGRMAAARELSKYGIAFKVSEDGGITGVYKEKVVFKIG